LLAGPFLSRDAAVAWAKAAWADETGAKKDKGEKLRRPLNPDPKREGPDLRNDRAIAGEEILTAFGFRGGEFGNWTNQADRQQALNASFDALHDLARVLGIPPKAVSLNGSLGIAFGARGSGRFAAHYEPMRVVINLTRTSGAGSLAHEWAHAFDNYIVKLSETANKLDFASDIHDKQNSRLQMGGVRFEILNAYEKLMRAMAKRAETQEEAIAGLKKQLERGQSSFRSWLPRPLTEDIKVLSAIALGEQPRVINGERVTAMEALAQLLKILPKETGYTSGARKRASALEQNLRYVIYREESIARAEAGERIGRNTSPTKFAQRAKELGDYWSRHHEMFARAFETFVQNKLSETNEKNEYLVHSAKSGGIPPEMEDKSAKEIGWMAAYPQGEEAVEINKAFEELFATLKQEEVDGKVRLYAPAPVRASVEQKALPADKLGAFIGVAGTLIQEGVKTPERLVEVLNAIFPEGQARPYSQALWDALGMIDNSLRGTHDWTSLYQAPAETPPAVEDPAPPPPVPDAAPLDLTRWASENMKALNEARVVMLNVLASDQGLIDALHNASNATDLKNERLLKAVTDYCVDIISANPPSIPLQYFMDRASRFKDWLDKTRADVLARAPEAPAPPESTKTGHVIQARNDSGEPRFYGDTNAIRDLEAAGWKVDHLGFGDFSAEKGELSVSFFRTENVTIPGQVGRAHQISGTPEAVQAAVLDIAGVIPDVQEDGQSSQTSDAGGPVADAADDSATGDEPDVSPPVDDGAGRSGGSDSGTTPGGQEPAASPDQTGGGGSRGRGPGVSGADSGSSGTAGAGGGGESGNAAPSGGNGRFRVQQTDRGVEVRAGRDVEPEDNLRIQPDEKLVPSGRTARIEANIAAIRLLRSMGDRLATPEEKRILAAFSGWGDTFQVFGVTAINDYQTAEDIIIGDRGDRLFGKSKDKFDRWTKQYRRHYDALREMLTDAEWQAAKESSLNAHYTSFPIIKALWSIAGRLGFKGGKALEPSAGNGTIIGLTPDSLAGAVQWTGIELDDLTAEILAKLYPASDIQHNGFEVSKRTENNSQDLVITNFPFGDYPIADVRHPDYDGWAIHDYFLARSVDAAKPGGLVIAITSRFTLDGSSKENVRQYVANKADLVAAFRLPNNAFKENAGTEVVTDILILRKRDGLGTSFGQRWITTIPTEFAIEAKAEADPETNEETDLDEEKPLRKKLKEESEVSINEETNTAKVPVNEYFAENPHHILGVQTMTGSMYGGNQYNVEASKGADLEALLAAAIEDLPENIFGAEASTEPRHVATVQGAKPNSYLVEGKSVLQVDAQGRAVKVNLTAAKAAQAGALIEIRDTVLGQLVLENDPMATDEDVEANRSRLNGFYDAYVKKHGALNESDLIDDDPEWPLVAAMEKPETFVVEQKITKGKKAGQIRLLTREKWVKGPILQGRVNRPPTPPENAGSLEEALSISLAYQGRVALHYISQLMGKPLDQVAADLPKDGIAFEDPETGRWEPSDYYLSGFVRDKLEAARTAAEEDPARWEHNVAALEKVQPKKAPIVDASFRLGGAWLPPSTIEKWMRETLEVEARLKFMRVGDSTQWAYTSVDGTLSPQNVNQFGGGEVPAHELIEDSLNLKMAKVEDPVYDDNGKEIGKKVNPEKTEAARQAQERLQAHFRTWVLNNPAEALKVEDAFDQQFGGIVLRETRVPAIERFPGASENIMLRYWQKRVVARAVSEGTLVAHDVGTGKTFSLISISMEMRRLGVASKPMIVVQNSTLGQFARSYKTLYPGAKILVGNEKRTKGENRAQFVAQAALEDWDAVIIPQSFFERLANDPKREEAYVTNRMREIEDAILQAEREAGNTDAIDFDKATTKKMKSALGKNMLKVRKRYKARLDRIFQRLEDKGDVMLTFEQTGVDALLVDEAHAFKRGDFYTKMDPVKGLDTNGSDRSMDFFLKTQFIHQRTPDRNVVLATGTPISNTLAEMWTMLRYVRPGLLKKFNVETFDDFAGGFTRVQSAVVETPTGDFKEVLRLARYDNGPVINNLWRSAVDIYSMDRADLKDVPTVKGGAPQPRIIDRTLMMGRLTEFLRKWRRWYDELPGKDKRDFNWLSLVQYGLARKGAVDIRLVDPDLEDEPGSKTNKVVEDVWEQYQASSDSLGTQLIFSNLFQSHDPTKQFLDKAETAINPLFGRPVFNVFEDIKAKLIAKGIPENEIAIFTDFSNEQKTAIGELVNAGKIRVAMGSTETLGTGLNVQQKVTTIYHLDPQFRPMDFTQRNGRGIRQGNENKEIEIVPYGMKNTMDSVLYSLMMTKAGMVAQAMQGKLGKEFEDPSDDDVMNYQSMAAAFSGNPALARQFALRNELRQLEIGEEDHARRQSAARDEWGVVNRGKATFLGQVEQSRLAVERLKKAFPEGKATELTHNGKTIGGKDFAKALTELIDGVTSEMEETMNRRFQSGGLKADVEAEVRRRNPKSKDLSQEWWPSIGEERSLNFELNGVPIGMEFSLEANGYELRRGNLDLGPGMQGRWGIKTAGFAMLAFNEATPWYGRLETPVGRATTGVGLRNSLENAIRNHLDAASEERIAKALNLMEVRLDQHLTDSKRPWEQSARLTEVRERLVEVDAQLAADPDAETQEEGPNIGQIAEEFAEFGWLTRFGNDPRSADSRAAVEEKQRQKAIKLSHVAINGVWIEVKSKKVTLPDTKGQDWFMANYKDGKRQVWNVTNDASGIGLGAGRTEAEALAHAINQLDKATPEALEYGIAKTIQKTGLMPRVAMVDGQMKDAFPLGARVRYQWATTQFGVFETRAGRVSGIAPSKGTIDVMLDDGSTQTVPMRQTDIGRREMGLPEKSATAPTPAEQTVENQLSEPEKQEIADLMGKGQWPAARADFMKSFADFLAGTYTATGRLLEIMKRLAQKVAVVAVIAAVSFSSANSKVTEMIYPAAQAIKASAPQFKAPQMGMPAAESIFGRLPKAPILPAAPAISYMEAPPAAAPAKTADFNGENAPADVVKTANWVVQAGNNEGKPFVIADKRNGALFTFDKTGTLDSKTPALFGKEIGDIANPNAAMEDASAKVTPSGRFYGEVVADEEYGKTVDFYSSNKDWNIAIHKVYLGDPSERRATRLTSESATDNRISYGCINLPESGMKSLLRNFKDTQGGYVYVLPETPKGRAAFAKQIGTKLFAPKPVRGPTKEGAQNLRKVWHSGAIEGAYDPTKSALDSLYGPGFYTAESPKRAKGYGKVEPRPFYIQTDKTFDADGPVSRKETNALLAFLELPTDAADWLYDDQKETGTPVTGEDVWNLLKDATTPVLANDALKSLGYDSITYTNSRGTLRDWVVFEASQIKSADSIDTAAQQAATSPTNTLPQPTAAQKDAGNYQKGHARIGGLDITIENPAGSTRSGVDKGGKAWSIPMQDHYGYVKGTEGPDGDHLDVFIAPGTPTDYRGPVHVIEQGDKEGKGFDEHKAVIGVPTAAEAASLYQRNYNAGWNGGKAIQTMPWEVFKTWATSQHAAQPLDGRRRLFAPKALKKPKKGPPAPIVHTQTIAGEADLQQKQVAASARSTPLTRVFRQREQFGRDVSNVWADFVSGNIDRIDYYAPGFRDIWLDTERNLALSRAAVNGLFQTLNARARAGFGYPAWWKNPKVWAQWRRFQAELLPVAARLEVDRVDDQGQFVWAPFNMRAGQISSQIVADQNKKEGDTINAGNETLVVGPGFSRRESTAGTGRGKMVYYNLLLRPMSAQDQQAIYQEFVDSWQHFPVVKDLLDEFIMPGMDKARYVGPRQFRTAEFNRYALRDFFNEWPQEIRDQFGALPEMDYVAGYVPEVPIKSGTPGIVGVIGELIRSYTSPTRRVETRGLRERGDVKDLFSGFQTTLMQAHLEKVRMERRGRLLKAAAVPMKQIPRADIDRWVPINDAFESVYDAIVLAKNLDPNKYPSLTGALNPDQLELMRSLVGEAFQLRGQNLAIPAAVFQEMLAEVATIATENLFLALLQWFVQQFNAAALASLQYLGMNFAGNELMKLAFGVQQAWRGVLLSLHWRNANAAKRRRLAFATFRSLIKGMVTDRFPLRQERLKQILPRELFDTNHFYNALDGMDLGVLDNIKRLQFGSAFLAAARTSNWDVGAKVQLANAIYQAYAREAWKDQVKSNPALKQATAAQKRTWLKNYVAGAPAELHREVETAAGEWLMNYENTPKWMNTQSIKPYVDPSRPQNAGKAVITAQLQKLAIGLLIPFIRWSYLFAKRIKRSTWNEGIKNLITRTGDKREGIANLMALGTMIAAPASLAFLGEGDDDDPDRLPAELLGRNRDVEGDDLDANLRTTNRFNASALARIVWTQMGLTEDVDFTLSDQAGQEQDLWMRYRNYPYIKEGIVMGLWLATLNQSDAQAAPDRIKRARTERNPNATVKDAFGQSIGALFGEYVSLGLGYSVIENIMANASGGQGSAQAQSDLRGTAIDFVTSPVLPHRLLRDINVMLDPVDRRDLPSKNLGYTPGWKEAIMSRIPGLKNKLPMEGKVAPAAIFSSKSSVPVAEQKALLKHFDIPATAVQYTKSKGSRDVFADLKALQKLGAGPQDIGLGMSETKKPTIAYPAPSQVRQRSVATEFVRANSPFNLLPVNQDAYKKAIRAKKDE
jgi:N12 class adenine-specific DNA methylase